MTTTADHIRELGARWVDAELAADVETLATLAADDFRLVGPFGFVLDKQQWLDRYRSGDLSTSALSWHDVDLREYGDSVVTIGTQSQQAAYKGSPFNGDYRITHVFVRDGDQWVIAVITTDVETGLARGLGELASPVHGVVPFPQFTQPRTQLRVAHRTRRRQPDLGVVVSGRGDLQCLADRLDPPSPPTGHIRPVGVDERDYLFGRPSSSVAKKTDAAFKMSFARRSSRTSHSSCAIRCPSALDVPARRPASISACLSQPRNDSEPIPSSRATRVTTP
jgi:ketosteroid isomerase-like protein